MNPDFYQQNLNRNGGHFIISPDLVLFTTNTYTHALKTGPQNSKSCFEIFPMVDEFPHVSDIHVRLGTGQTHHHCQILSFHLLHLVGTFQLPYKPRSL